MNRNLMSVTLFPVDINGIVNDPLESVREINIITGSSEYQTADEIKIHINIKNDLLRDVRIVKDNCGVPVFILEKKIEDNWERVYLSDTLGLPIRSISPALLPSDENFSAEIVIYSPDIQDDDIEGEYRLIFNLIEKENNVRIPEKYLYSNVFKIQE